MALLAMSGSAAVLADVAVQYAVLDADGRTITVTVPGMEGFRCGFAARAQIAGSELELSSAAGRSMGPPAHSTEATPYGQAEVAGTTIHFDNEQVDLLFHLGWVPGVPGVLLQAGIRNTGHAPLKLDSLTAVAMDEAGPGGRVGGAGCVLQPAGKPEDWLITGLQTSLLMVRALTEFSEPLVVHEVGGFYHQDAGTGFLFGPIGTPTACVEARFTPLHDGKTLFNFSADMSGARVDADETRWGQQVVLLMEPARTAMARWAEWVGQTHGARTSKGALSGWNNWNFRPHKSIDKEVFQVVDAVQQSGGRLRPEVIQIDDAVQPGRAALDAPWLPLVVERVGETGARLGLRLGFDRNAKPPAPDAATGTAEIVASVRRAVQAGVVYLKISCPPTPPRAADEKRTAFEICRDDWAAIRQAAGEAVYLLCCDTASMRAAVGSVDACRVGADASRLELRSVMTEVMGSYPLNGRWFAVDFDVYYMAGEIEGMSNLTGGWPVMQTWLSMVGLSCGAAITSEPWYWKEFKPHWRNAEVLTPPARERSEALNLCNNAGWSRLVGHVRRDWGESTVALLWNPRIDIVAPLRLDFAEAGLNPDRRYAVWSFWDNQFLGVAKGSWTTPVLLRGASQHLCFTELDRTPNQPVLIGSNLHIYCGAAEISQVVSSRDAMRIELTDAGARAGDLFVYSRWPIGFKSATGCAVSGVVNAGENVWRISLADRQHNAPQRLELTVQLPVTRQAWFWLLIATAVASLLFAAWRYVAGWRLEREHVLDRERARIARDLHDDLGANLAEIAMISELAHDELEADDPSRVHFSDIFNRCENNVRRLGEIVWAVNPANDTLERFAGYLCKFTQDYLALARIRCRLDLPETLPPVLLNSVRRHNLFLGAKEAIHNAVQRGAPSEITLRIATRNGQLIITIEDNGRGFDTTQPLADARGSANMQSRMEQIGGAFTRRSAPGQGTTVTLTAPFTPL